MCSTSFLTQRRGVDLSSSGGVVGVAQACGRGSWQWSSSSHLIINAIVLPSLMLSLLVHTSQEQQQEQEGEA